MAHQIQAFPQDDGARKLHRVNPPDFSRVDTFVTFLVGPETDELWPQKFLVHKEVACYHSPVLNAAFNSEFIEGRTQTYILDDTTTGAFQLLMQWLYGKRVQLPALHKDFQEDKEINVPQEDTQRLVELWVLADKLAIPKLQNLAIKKINKINNRFGKVYTASFQYMYQHTAKDSQLRKFLVELTALRMDPDDITEGQIPEAMLLDLVIFHARRRHGRKEVIPEEFFVEEDCDGE